MIVILVYLKCILWFLIHLTDQNLWNLGLSALLEKSKKRNSSDDVPLYYTLAAGRYEDVAIGKLGT